MERLRLEFEGLARPSGLPPPGEPLPCIEEPPELPPHLQHQQVRNPHPARLEASIAGSASYLIVGCRPWRTTYRAACATPDAVSTTSAARSAALDTHLFGGQVFPSHANSRPWSFLEL